MASKRGSGPSQRQLRVGEEVRHALALALERTPLRDPRLAGVSVTVTEVRMSPDLKTASAYVLPLRGAESGEVVSALNHAAPFLRGRLARQLRLKHLPSLRFLYDDSFDRAGRIAELLKTPRVARDLLPGEAEGEGSREAEGEGNGP